MGDAGIWFVIGAIAVWATGIGLAIAGSIDAALQPRPAWSPTGYRRELWLWQAAGVVAVPISLVVSAVYWLRVRPHLTRAARNLGLGLDDADPAWSAGQRWYDRLNYSRRSPARWARAAQQWWTWPLVGAFNLLLAAQRGWLLSHHRGFAADVVLVPLLGLASLLSLWRPGFWYAEHMRLTGLRPHRGGRLLTGTSDRLPE